MDGFGKIAIGCRIGQKADPAFVASWTRLILEAVRPGDKVLQPIYELPAHFAASILADQFINMTECDTLFMVDDDMVFDPQDLDALRDDPDCWPHGIVQGLCCSRRPPHDPVILLATDKPGIYRTMNKPGDCNRVIEVGACGLAFTLIRRSTFMAIASVKRGADLVFRWGSDGRGEDVSFCEDARKVGVTVGVNARVGVGHRCSVTLIFDGAANRTAFRSPFSYGLSELRKKQVDAINADDNK